MPCFKTIPLSAVECYSEIARPGERAFCVTVPEMIKCGISETYITKKAIAIQRNKAYACWPYHKEGDKIYLHYNGLKEEYKSKVRTVLLGGLTPDEWYNRNGRVEELIKKFSPYLFLSADDDKFFNTAVYPSGEKLPFDVQQKCKEACSWLSFLSIVDKNILRKLGYVRVVALIEDVTFLFSVKGIQLPTTYTKLRKKIRDYKAQGPACCIDKRGQKNKRASKVFTEEQVAVLRTICSKGASYNSFQIAALYNMIADAKGWERISRRSASNYLKEYKIFVEAGRNSAEAFRNRISMQIRRLAPTEALSFWTLDGWTAELYYRKDVKDKKGKVIHTYQNRLTVVVVLDACCKYPVGFAIGENESVDLIRAAVKNAIDYTRDTLGDYYSPYQIQSDRFGVKSMGTIYKDVAKYFTPARVKNAKSKPVERYFKYLNTAYCQLHFGNLNWSGFGITSKKDSQPNIDVLDFNKKDFPDKEGVINQITWIINEERKKKHETWIAAWNRMPVEDRRVLDRESYLLHFGQKNDRTKRLEAGTFNPTILGEPRLYDSFDLDFRKNPLESWTVRYDERDLNTILVSDSTEKKRFLLEAVHLQPTALRDRHPGDFEALQQVDRFNKQTLEPYVIDTLARDAEIVENLISQSRELEGKQAYTLLSDSQGQHKAHLRHSALIKSEEDLAAEVEEKQALKVVQTLAKQRKKEEKKKIKASEVAYEEYARSVIEIDKFK